MTFDFESLDAVRDLAEHGTMMPRDRERLRAVVKMADAAPELYEALDMLTKAVWEENPDRPMSGRLSDAMRDALNAMKKARGES